jgi:hypothetical protein
MGLKRGAIGKTLGEHTGNLMGTHWELEGNMVGNKGKMKKNPPSLLRPHFECMLSLTIGYMKFLFGNCS